MHREALLNPEALLCVLRPQHDATARSLLSSHSEPFPLHCLRAPAAERMDATADLRVIMDSHQLTDSMDGFIARARGNRALAIRLSCVKSLVYRVRSSLEASIRDCPEGSRDDRCEQLRLLLSQMVEVSWVSCALCLPARWDLCFCACHC